ncbi:MAG: hypothetical protein ACR2KG_06555 [Nocardioidaceae bacterium]
MPDAWPLWSWVLVALLVLTLVLATGWLSWTAGRLDRMHLRCEASVSSLQTQLVRRASLAAELATGGLTDPASALLLLETAAAARDGAANDGSWQEHSDLTAALRAVQLPTLEEEPLMADLADACRRVSLMRRIHNDQAATTIALRQRRRVRWFRLAGEAPEPAMVAFDDRDP